MFKSIDEWVFSINSKPYGASYGEWAARWCQWMLTIPKSKNPTLDPEGNNAYINQDNPHVFFLCQTWDNGCADSDPYSKYFNRAVYFHANY